MRKVSIIIPYVKGPDNGLELRYALRSIETYFKHDNYEIILVGDKPAWIKNIKYIPFTRLPERPFRAFQDQIIKLYTVLTEYETTNDFIWTYDDVYFTSPVKISDIKQLKAARHVKSISDIDSYPGGSNWKICIKQALDDTAGEFVYETHLPRWYNKNKMLQLYNRYYMLSRPTVIATLYYNHYYPDEQPKLLNDNKDHIRLMIRSLFEPDRLEKLVRRAKFTNNNPASFNSVFKEVLSRLFPNNSKYEADPR